MPEYTFIGKSVPRVDAPVKVTGEAVYATDLKFPGMLVGKIKGSPHPFARILRIKTENARRLPGVHAVVTARDVSQHPYGIFIDDELALPDGYVRYVGDHVAAVAASDEETAEEALELIEVEYEVLKPVFDPEEAVASGASAIHPERKDVKNNVMYRLELRRGKGEDAFAEADLILEDRFATQAAHQAYLEPQACVAQWTTPDKATVWGTTQHVFTNAQYLAKSLGLPVSQVRIIQPYVGGGFGGKQELYPNFPIAVFLARASGRPVKIVYSREEDFVSGRPRTSDIVNLKLGFKKDGTMVAKKMDVIKDAGAYAGISPLIMRVGATRADGMYRLPNVQTVARVVYTNTLPRGAFRGFGDPQVHFAMETLIDRAAREMGIGPIDIRLKNAVRKGDTTQHGLVLRSCAFSETLKVARRSSGWNKARQKREPYHGFGVACQVHNAGNRAATKRYGFFGSGGLITIDSYGKVRVYNGEIELGQGMLTVFAQIVAEVLGVGMEDVEVVPFVDSDVMPFGLGTSGSKVTQLGGNALILAAKDARRQLLQYAAERARIKPIDLELRGGRFYRKSSAKEVDNLKDVARYAVLSKLGGVPIIGRGEYVAPSYVTIPDESMYGNMSPAWTFSTVAVEVKVDPETGKVSVLNVWQALDIGKALNPKSCEGQVEGGTLQGMGYALTEAYIWKNGVVLNPNFTDYKVPTMRDTPAIHSLFVEKPNPGSPFGAKGIGEHTLIPIAPAIANAVYDAVGVRINDLPLMAEKVFMALKANRRQK